MTLKNTDNDYRIIVRNKQTADGETNVIKELAYGSLREKNGKQYILYSLEDDGDTVTSLIKLDGDEVLIKRGGALKTSMEYKAGEKRSFVYETPYGGIDMELETHRVLHDVAENGGEVELVYTLTVQGEKYFNDTKITITKIS